MLKHIKRPQRKGIYYVSSDFGEGLEKLMGLRFNLDDEQRKKEKDKQILTLKRDFSFLRTEEI